MDALSPNPLHEVHRQAEADFQPYGDIDIVSTYGQPQAEYAALARTCGLFDQPHRAILSLTGTDRLDFLNRILTNQTWDKQTKSGLAAGEGCYAFLLTANGRIVTDLNVLERGDSTLLEMEFRQLATVQSFLQKYIFTEKVRLESKIGQWHQIALHGPGAAKVIGDWSDNATDLTSLPQLGSLATTVRGIAVTCWRDDVTGAPGYHMIIPADSARVVWMELISRFGPTLATGSDEQPRRPALRPVGWAVFNARRIEAGRPLFGIDFDETVLPAETGLLDRAVSFAKGCYLGQEIVARMHARGQLARKIAGFRMSDDALPVAGTGVLDADKNPIGTVTSSTISPVLSNASIGLAMLKRPSFEIGSKIAIPAEGAIRQATVVHIPFLENTPP
jgi:folate-binding protein YgfZ